MGSVQEKIKRYHIKKRYDSIVHTIIFIRGPVTSRTSFRLLPYVLKRSFFFFLEGSVYTNENNLFLYKRENCIIVSNIKIYIYNPHTVFSFYRVVVHFIFFVIFI